MLSRDKLKASSLSTPVPLDMINAWLRGEYLIGQNESSGYELLGWTLMLRGLYVYGVTFNEGTDEGTIANTGTKSNSETASDATLPTEVLEKMSAWGICKIDVDEGDINFHGIRLGRHKVNFGRAKKCTAKKEEMPSDPAQHQEASQPQKSAEHPVHLVWYSIFSKLTRVPGASTPDMYFGYVLFPIRDEEKYNFQWFSTMTSVQQAGRDSEWEGFELPMPPSSERNPSLGWTGQYPRDFREKLCEYLLEVESDIDRPSLKSKDTVSAIAHLPLEKWKPNIRCGVLQPTLGPDNEASTCLPACATIYFFPLMMDEPLGNREKSNQK